MFLQRMAKSYELVLFGDQEKGFIEEVAMGLDPNMMMFSGHLGRESTIARNGRYIKDFSYLGRPLKEVVYIDFTTESVPFHTENCIVLPEFDGDPNDRALYDILPFLERKWRILVLDLFGGADMAQKPSDVRNEIKLYGNEGTA